MDSAIYTLIGALGGVIATQVSNYFLEDKKAKNLMALKAMEIRHQYKIETVKEKRVIYSKFLECVDSLPQNDEDKLKALVSSYYAALIVTDKENVNAINDVFVLSKDYVPSKDFDSAKFKNAKKEC